MNSVELLQFASACMSGVEVPAADVAALHRAVDGSLLIVSESLDGAGQSPGDDCIGLARILVDAATRVYAAQSLRDGLQAIADAIRETGPEIAGAISEAGTDIGSSLHGTLSPLCGNRVGDGA